MLWANVAFKGDKRINAVISIKMQDSNRLDIKLPASNRDQSHFYSGKQGGKK